MEPTHIKRLNRRLAESLPSFSGERGRFAWKYAPDQPWLVYAPDNVTLIKKSWADMPAPDGQPLGAAWLLSVWTDGRDELWEQGVRVPSRNAGYSPYFETACPRGMMPSEDLNQQYIHDIDRQLSASAEFNRNSFDNYMTDEKYTSQRNNSRDRRDWLETARGQYDDHIGAFGNCAPGTRGGYMSFGGA